MENKNDLLTVLMETAVRKLENQYTEMKALTEKLKDTPEMYSLLEGQGKTLAALDGKLDAATKLELRMKEYSGRMDAVVAVLGQPVQNTTVHHHHFPKIFYLTLALYLTVGFMGIGWIQTAHKLDSYRENDTKYRYLSFLNDRRLLSTLSTVDSLFRADPALTDSVSEWESIRNRRLEVLQRVLELERNAKDLRK